MPITRHHRLLLPALCLMLAASGCAAPPPSQAEQADLAACTSQADAAYKAQNYESLSRTEQTGLRYAPMPNHVFDAQQLGAMHVRDDQISDCVNNGGTATPVIPGAPLVTPQIIGPQP